MMNELNKENDEDVRLYIATMLESGFTYGEIKQKLISNSGFTQYEADKAIDKILKVKLSKSIKSGLWISLALVILTMIMWVLYFYFKYKEAGFARLMIEKGNGIDLGNGKVMLQGPFNTYQMFGKFTVYSGIAAVIAFIRVGINWLNFRKIK